MSSRGLYLALCSVFLLLTGCGVQPPSTAAHGPLAAGVSGIVMGGQQPVSGSTVQLYTVGTASDGSAATPLLTKTVTSGSDGSFSISGLYNNCAGATQVYLTATSGNPGLSAANPNLALMVALGPCSALTPGTSITINELTTVAAAVALAPYVSGTYTSVGSSTSDVSALQAAFALAAEYVSTISGTAGGANVPSGYTVPTALINTLGDIVAACVNSTGGTAGDGSACGSLFGLLTPTGGTAPTDTFAALVLLAASPNLNTSQLFSLIPSSPPFQPMLSSVPNDFLIRLTPPANLVPLAISSATLTFPSTTIFTVAPIQTVTVMNTNSSAVSIYSPTSGTSPMQLLGLSPADFSINNLCPATLAAQASCTIQVTATPTVPGARTALLQINSNTVASPQYVSLQTTGVANSLSPSNIYIPSYTNPSVSGNFSSTSVGTISVYASSASGAASPINTITGLTHYNAYELSFDSNGYLYALGSTQNIASAYFLLKYQLGTAGSGSLISTNTLSGISTFNPQGYSFAVDSTGRAAIPVDNFSTTPNVYSTAIYAPLTAGTNTISPAFNIASFGGASAIDPNNNLFAVNASGATNSGPISTSSNDIGAFAPGFTASSTVSRDINPAAYFQPFTVPLALAADRAGNVYYLVETQPLRTSPNSQINYEILQYSTSASGTATATRVITIPASTAFLNSIAVDGNGVVYAHGSAAATRQQVIYEWAPTTTGSTPSNIVYLTGVGSTGIAVY